MKHSNTYKYLITGILCGMVLLTISSAYSADQTNRVDSDMILIEGGRYYMGSDNTYADARPVHPVVINSFRIDRYEVTNAQFSEFVDAAGYVTTAEKEGFAWCYLEGEADFRAVEGANWRHPYGPGSSISNRMNHPVVCVSWEDATAFAIWAGKRLPTEAEWEYAARAGGERHFEAHQPTSNADDHSNIDFIDANVWQGSWPATNLESDGFFYTAPVGSYPANDFGLHDMVGNVWEWTADWYDGDYYAVSPSRAPTGPDSGKNRVARGGSWFCSSNYCGAYSTHYRGASPPNHAFNNVGFRCAADQKSEGQSETAEASR